MSVIKAVIDYLQSHTLVLAILSAFGGGASAILLAIIGDFFKFREYRRSNTQVEFEKSKASQVPLDLSLQKFSDKALGLREPTADDLEILQKEIKTLRNSAKNLVDRIPALEVDFDRLSKSLVELQKNAQAVNGPADAKGFVQSVAEYYSSANYFFSRAARLQHFWTVFNKRQLKN